MADAMVEAVSSLAEPFETVGSLVETGADSFRDWRHKQLNKVVAPLAYYHVVKYMRYFSWRTMLASALFHGAKGGIKRLARRTKRPRVVQAAEFITNVLLPTTVFGPALGVTAGLVQMNGRVPPPEDSLLMTLVPSAHPDTPLTA